MNDWQGARSRAPVHGRVVRSALGAAVALLAVLCGCVSVLPKAPPVQLYTFGQRPPANVVVARAPPLDQRVAVVLTAVTLPRAAAGDQILTLTGQEAAYVAGARWVEPAVLMFQADAERSLVSETRRIRLLARSDYGAARSLLRLDVGDFEARYDPGRDTAPTVLVSLRATLSQPGGEVLADGTFTAREAAAENRVGAIVDAYDRATLQVLDQAATWTDANAPAPPLSSSDGPTAPSDATMRPRR